MKTYKRLLIIFCCTFILSSNLFMCYTMPVFAKPTLDDDGHLHVYNWDDIKDCATDWVMYMASLAGAIFADRDFAKYVQNKESWVDYWKEDNVNISEGGTSVTFSKELMTYIKQCIDEYAKEHEPYHMVETYPLNSIPMSNFANHKNVYDTLVNLLNESPSGVVLFGCSGGTMVSTDLGQRFTRLSPVLYDNSPRDIEKVRFYQNENWDILTFRIWSTSLAVDDPAIKTISEFAEKAGNNYLQINNSYSCPICTVHKTFKIGSPKDYSISASGSQYDTLFIISKDARRIRVFNTYGDFQNYTLGKRSVYYTNEYYNYVPEDLTTSIDDLQQTVDDLSGVIDKLLGQITDTTDESEIEDLLKQILDELKNNQCGGGGGGSGGGDVNVDIDLSTTNTLLSNILAKVTQIFDRMSETAEGAADTVHAKIQETLDEILVQIKKLKHWTMADTAANAADAVADWLDFIKGIFDDAENGAGSAVSALSSTMGDAANLMKTKFPFCIPWDVYLIIGFLAEEPQTPVFRLPIKLERLGIEEYIEIDLKDFEAVSSISRTLFTVLYCYGLLNLTMKVFPVAKEGD